MYQVNRLRLVDLVVMLFKVHAINLFIIFNTNPNKFLYALPPAHPLMSTMLEHPLLHHKKSAQTKTKVEIDVLLTSCSLLL